MPGWHFRNRQTSRNCAGFEMSKAENDNAALEDRGSFDASDGRVWLRATAISYYRPGGRESDRTLGTVNM